MMTLLEKELQRKKRNARLLLVGGALLVGILGSVWSYNNRVREKQKAEATRDSLRVAVDSIALLNNLNDSMRKALNHTKDSLAKLITDAEQGNNLNLLIEASQEHETAKAKAKLFEKKGYQAMNAGHLEQALEHFRDCEAAYNGYRFAFEIWRLLRTNKSKLNDPSTISNLQTKIKREYPE